MSWRTRHKPWSGDSTPSHRQEQKLCNSDRQTQGRPGPTSPFILGSTGEVAVERRAGYSATTHSHGSFIFKHGCSESGLSQSYWETYSNFKDQNQTNMAKGEKVPTPSDEQPMQMVWLSTCYVFATPIVGNTDKIPPRELTFKVKRQITN